MLARRAGQLLDLVILPALLILFIIFMPCLVFPRGYEAILCYEHSHCSASNLQGFSACPALSPPTDPVSKSYNCGMLHPDLMVPWSPGAPLLTGYPAAIPELCPATSSPSTAYSSPSTQLRPFQTPFLSCRASARPQTQIDEGPKVLLGCYKQHQNSETWSLLDGSEHPTREARRQGWGGSVAACQPDNGVLLNKQNLSVEIKYEAAVASIVCIPGVALY